MVCLETTGGGLKFKRFRLGRILNAEVTAKQQRFSGLTKAAYPQKYKKTAFAAITVQFDPKRSISKYDFTLKANGKEYPCVAIRKDNGVEKWKFEKTDPESLYTIFFMVNAPNINYGSPLKFDLIYKLHHRGPTSMKLKFKNLGNRDFTSAKNVSRKGMLTVRRTKKTQLSLA